MPAHAEIRRPLTLDELVAWNDELAALVRAGLPLEEGLINLGSEYSGRLGSLVRQMGNRLASGVSLADLMADRSLGFPPLWQALVVAGLRSGRLDAVLASLANSGRCLASLRQAFGLALLYPVIVVITAYAAWLLLVVHLAPIWADAFVDLTGSGDRVLDLLLVAGKTVAWWWPWPPLALGILSGIEWWRARRTFLASGPLSSLAAWVFPPIRRARNEAQLAAFCEVLGLLVVERTPLPDGVALAASCCGDDRLRQSLRIMEDRLREGGQLNVAIADTDRLPPLLGYLLATETNPDNLGTVLRQMAQRSRERSLAMSRRVVALLPIGMAVALGGTVVLGLAILYLLPVWRLLWTLGGPTS